MHRLPIVLLFIAALGGGAWFLVSDDQTVSPEHAPPSVTRAPAVEEVPGSSPPDLVSAVTREDARTAVRVEQTEPVAEDPCASVRAELDASRVELGDAQSELIRLRKDLADAQLEILRLQLPESTPYGAFLASGEAEQILEVFDGVLHYPKPVPGLEHPPRPAGEVALEQIKVWLDVIPVFLRPGEATWIAERRIARDWQRYGRNFEDAFILFLGPDRLIAELPPERLAELREDYAEEGYFD